MAVYVVCFFEIAKLNICFLFYRATSYNKRTNAYIMVALMQQNAGWNL